MCGVQSRLGSGMRHPLELAVEDIPSAGLNGGNADLHIVTLRIQNVLHQADQVVAGTDTIAGLRVALYAGLANIIYVTSLQMAILPFTIRGSEVSLSVCEETFSAHRRPGGRPPMLLTYGLSWTICSFLPPKCFACTLPSACV